MLNPFSLKTSLWDFNKSEYDDIDNLPLMSTPGPVCGIIALYLVFVLKIGPDIMSKRNPYNLTRILLAYNSIQVVLSAYLVQKFFRQLLETGLAPQKCFLTEENHRKEIVFNIWLYWATKVIELIDTLLFVFRKKYNQITFLHLYHHSSMVIVTWGLLKYSPSQTLIFIVFVNSLVHVFMYTYYGLAVLGPSVAKYLTWKKYITTLQLLQFVSIIIQYIASVRISECPPSKGVAIFVVCNTTFFLLLFANFYVQSYKKKKEVKGAVTKTSMPKKMI